MWPPRPLCPPSFGIFPKIHPFWRRHLSLSHWLCSWRFSLVSYFTFVFFGGHYECLQATYSDPYLIFSFTIFSSWHQEPDCLLCLHCRLGHAEALPCLEIDPTPARRIRGKSMARPWQVLQVSNSFHVISQISLFWNKYSTNKTFSWQWYLVSFVMWFLKFQVILKIIPHTKHFRSWLPFCQSSMRTMVETQDSRRTQFVRMTGICKSLALFFYSFIIVLVMISPSFSLQRTQHGYCGLRRPGHRGLGVQ